MEPEKSVGFEQFDELAKRIESVGFCMEIDALLINHGYEGANYLAEPRIVALDLPPSKQILSFIKFNQEHGDLK